MSELAAEYRRQLAATLRWCQPRFDSARAASSLRSPELAPNKNIVVEAGSLEDINRTVTDVLNRRLQLLDSPTASAGLPPADRILLFFPQRSLWHGSSVPETDGFIDEDEIPPWDSWIVLANEMLLSWVPASMVAGVDTAIRINPEECILWASDHPHPLMRELLEMGLVR